MVPASIGAGAIISIAATPMQRFKSAPSAAQTGQPTFEAIKL